MSKKIFFAAAAVLSLATGRAFAESDGNPFPFAAVPQVTNGRAFLIATGSEQYPLATGDTVQASSLALLEPVNGQEGIVHTDRSLPRGFDDGTVMTARVRKNGDLEAGVGRPAS